MCSGRFGRLYEYGGKSTNVLDFCAAAWYNPRQKKRVFLEPHGGAGAVRRALQSVCDIAAEAGKAELWALGNIIKASAL